MLDYRYGNLFLKSLITVILYCESTLPLEEEAGKVNNHSDGGQSEADAPVEAGHGGQARPAGPLLLIPLPSGLFVFGHVF
jgi:hypothetical protein